MAMVSWYDVLYYCPETSCSIAGGIEYPLEIQFFFSLGFVWRKSASNALIPEAVEIPSWKFGDNTL